MSKQRSIKRNIQRKEDPRTKADVLKENEILLKAIDKLQKDIRRLKDEPSKSSH